MRTSSPFKKPNSNLTTKLRSYLATQPSETIVPQTEVEDYSPSSETTSPQNANYLLKHQPPSQKHKPSLSIYQRKRIFTSLTYTYPKKPSNKPHHRIIRTHQPNSTPNRSSKLSYHRRHQCSFLNLALHTHWRSWRPHRKPATRNRSHHSEHQSPHTTTHYHHAISNLSWHHHNICQTQLTNLLDNPPWNVFGSPTYPHRNQHELKLQTATKQTYIHKLQESKLEGLHRRHWRLSCQHSKKKQCSQC